MSSNRFSTVSVWLLPVCETYHLTCIYFILGRPRGSGKKQKQQQQQLAESASKNLSPFLGWPSLAYTRKRTSDNLFQLNGTPRKVIRGKEDGPFPSPQTQPSASIPAKGLFSSSSFEVDSFSSIANGYSSSSSSFCAQTKGPDLSLSSRSGLYQQKSRQDELVTPRSRKSGQEFLVKLDHEGVTSPKTKNSKALLLRGGSSSVSSISTTEAYSHPVLLVKDNKKGGNSRVELLLKGGTHQRKPSPSLRLEEYSDLDFSSHRECHSSYSDMDEEEEEERRSAALAAASGGLRTANHFLSHLSVSSSSSGSSSSSSSGSVSSSSLCSSDNDSSYSSEDEDSSALMLQSCLSSHRGLLQPSTPTTSPRPHQHSFVAKAVAVSNTKGNAADHMSSNKALKRKECTSSSPKSKEVMKKPRMLTQDTSFIPRPKMSTFLAGRQMWRWSGNPTQVRPHILSFCLFFFFDSYCFQNIIICIIIWCLAVFAEARFEGQGQETLLQGHCTRQRHSESGRLCSVPLSWSPQSPVHWSNWKLLGILDLQHGGQSQVVLSPRRDQVRQKTSRWQGNSRRRLYDFYRLTSTDDIKINAL